MRFLQQKLIFQFSLQLKNDKTQKPKKPENYVRTPAQGIAVIIYVVIFNVPMSFLVIFREFDEFECVLAAKCGNMKLIDLRVKL